MSTRLDDLFEHREVLTRFIRQLLALDVSDMVNGCERLEPRLAKLRDEMIKMNDRIGEYLLENRI